MHATPLHGFLFCTQLSVNIFTNALPLPTLTLFLENPHLSKPIVLLVSARSYQYKQLLLLSEENAVSLTPDISAPVTHISVTEETVYKRRVRKCFPQQVLWPNQWNKPKVLAGL